MSVQPFIKETGESYTSTNKRLINEAGKKYGRLLVLRTGRNKYTGSTGWVCKCDCGKELNVLGHKLRSGSTVSCGCYNLDRSKSMNYKHGMNGTKFHNTWLWMLARCYQKKNSGYKDYGGRGIMVCDRWHDFSKFYEDMFESYTKHFSENNGDTSIERIDVDGNYEPSNCKWIRLGEQHKNTRKSKTYVKQTKKLEVHG